MLDYQFLVFSNYVDCYFIFLIFFIDSIFVHYFVTFDNMTKSAKYCDNVIYQASTYSSVKKAAAAASSSFITPTSHRDSTKGILHFITQYFYLL